MIPIRPESILAAYLHKGSIPHALVFFGMAGVDKTATANRFAMACNCQSLGSSTAEGSGARSNLSENRPFLAPCGKCKACQKIKSGNHPDILTIEPSGTAIKIAQIRTLCVTLSLRPYEAQYRVVIFPQAESMTQSAANALLKVLEEPPQGTVIILITRRLTDLLPTIRSRCQPVRFAPLSEKDLARTLIEEHALNPEQAQTIAALSGGSRSRARQMIAPGWNQARHWLLQEVAALPKAPLQRCLALAEKLTLEKDQRDERLTIIKSWIRDLAFWHYDRDRILNRDKRDQIRHAAGNYSQRRLATLYGRIEQTQQRLLTPANPRLAMELLCLELASNRSEPRLQTTEEI